MIIDLKVRKVGNLLGVVLPKKALALNDMLLSQYGGFAGVRGKGLLDSALARPQQHLAYGKPSLLQNLQLLMQQGSSKIIPFLMEIK